MTLELKPSPPCTGEGETSQENISLPHLHSTLYALYRLLNLRLTFLNYLFNKPKLLFKHSKECNDQNCIYILILVSIHTLTKPNLTSKQPFFIFLENFHSLLIFFYTLSPPLHLPLRKKQAVERTQFKEKHKVKEN